MKPNCHVLIIDGNDEEARQLSAILKAAGAGVRVCRDAPSGLDAFETLRPDLILIDERVSKVEGAQFGQLLMRTEPGRLTPVILMSPLERRRRTRALSAHGYAMHLRKPIGSKELLDAFLHYLPQALTEAYERSLRRGHPSPTGKGKDAQTAGREDTRGSREESPLIVKKSRS